MSTVVWDPDSLEPKDDFERSVFAFVEKEAEGMTGILSTFIRAGIPMSQLCAIFDDEGGSLLANKDLILEQLAKDQSCDGVAKRVRSIAGDLLVGVVMFQGSIGVIALTLHALRSVGARA